MPVHRSLQARLPQPLTLLILGGLSLLLSACGSSLPPAFKGSGVPLVLEDYFVGKTRADGVFIDFFCNVGDSFVVDIDGTWDGSVLTLDEDFTYADGRKQRRVWRITKVGPDRYVGRAADVIGEARGEVRGSTLTWTYDVDLDLGNRTQRVTFDDVLFLRDEKTLLNQADIRVGPLVIGVVTINFRKL